MRQMKTLKEAKVGSTVKVVKLHGEGAVKRRIMDMGITRGVEVYIRKVARSEILLKLTSAVMSFRSEKPTLK